VEWRGGGGGDKVGTGGYFQKELRCTREKRVGRVRVKP
jgi:hypothetical protein